MPATVTNQKFAAMQAGAQGADANETATIARWSQHDENPDYHKGIEGWIAHCTNE